MSDLLVSNNAAGVAAFGTHLDGLFAHRLLASRETKGKVIPLLVLAQTYGAINGIASGCSSSVTTLMYPTLSPAFFAPTGSSRIDLLPSLFLAAFPLLLGICHPRFRASQLNRYALSCSLVETCRTLFPPFQRP